jgi:ribonuclease BN (tRNA processing enzyme)
MSNAYRLSVLEASSSLCPPGDANASLHLDTPTRSLLIDAGGNVPSLLEQHGRDFRELTDIIITHEHLDHTYGLPFLSHCFYSEPHSVRCWAPPETVSVLRDVIQAHGLEAPDRYLDIDFRELNPEEIHQIDLLPEVETWVHPTEHSPSSIGVSFRRSDRSLTYSGDSASSNVLFALPFTPNILIHECQAAGPYASYFEEVHATARSVSRLAGGVGSRVLVPAEPCAVKPGRKDRRPISKAAQIALKALRMAVDEAGSVPPVSNHIPTNLKTVDFELWRRYAYQLGISAGEVRAQQRAFKRSAETLVADEFVGMWHGQCWPI